MWERSVRGKLEVCYASRFEGAVILGCYAPAIRQVNGSYENQSANRNSSPFHL